MPAISSGWWDDIFYRFFIDIFEVSPPKVYVEVKKKFSICFYKFCTRKPIHFISFKLFSLILYRNKFNFENLFLYLIWDHINLINMSYRIYKERATATWKVVVPKVCFTEQTPIQLPSWLRNSWFGRFAQESLPLPMLKSLLRSSSLLHS